MRLRTETLANWTIIITGIAVTSLVGIRAFNETRGTPRAQTGPQRFQVGTSVAQAIPVKFSEADQTVLLVLSSSCQYCTQSMPFYRDLVNIRKNLPARTKLIAVGFEEPSSLRQYLNDHGVAVDHVLTVTPAAVMWTATPTLIVADSGGKITALWNGAIPDQRQKEVLAKLAERKG